MLLVFRHNVKEKIAGRSHVSQQAAPVLSLTQALDRASVLSQRAWRASRAAEFTHQDSVLRLLLSVPGHLVSAGRDPLPFPEPSRIWYVNKPSIPAGNQPKWDRWDGWDGWDRFPRF